MNLLLDTHTFWWMVNNDPRLPTKIQEMLGSFSNNVFCSDISAWEIAIKSSLGRMPVPEAVDVWYIRQLRASDLTHKPIDLRAIARVRDLPWYHRDPFDRLLAATALCDDLTLVSRDDVFDQYGVKRVW